MTSEQKQPLVSVIVPNYNHARYLKQRLDSVFGQTYPNFEVIILDDCSTDNSLEVINRYKDNPHLSQIVVNETNSGSPFKQWNKGINLAKGELIWIAESDDYCELNMLEELVGAYLAKPNVVVAFSSYIMFDDEGGKYIPPIHGTAYYYGKDFVSKWLAMDCVIRNASGAVFKKDAFLQIPNSYANLRQCGDYLFWVMIAEHGYVAYVNKNLTYFRITNGVTSVNNKSSIVAKEDKMVFDYIDNKYHFSKLRKYLIKAKRWNSYQYYININDPIFQEINEVWGFKKRYSPYFVKLYMYVFNKLRLYFNILI